MVAGAELETINRTANYDPGWLELNLKIALIFYDFAPTQSTFYFVLNKLQTGNHPCFPVPTPYITLFILNN